MHVAVIGAGIAGLVAAYRLSHSGHRVTVLETQARTGGRALTIRSFFPDELVGQAGPSRFLGDFRRVFDYAGKFGLELAPYYPGSGTVVAYFKEKRIEEYHPSPECRRSSTTDPPCSSKDDPPHVRVWRDARLPSSNLVAR
jgi:monoamine oxidase